MNTALLLLIVFCSLCSACAVAMLIIYIWTAKQLNSALIQLNQKDHQIVELNKLVDELESMSAKAHAKASDDGELVYKYEAPKRAIGSVVKTLKDTTTNIGNGFKSVGTGINNATKTVLKSITGIFKPVKVRKHARARG